MAGDRGSRVEMDSRTLYVWRDHSAPNLQRSFYHACDHHDLLRRDADHGRLFRQLLDSADDRYAGHGLSQVEHAFFLGGCGCRGGHARELLRSRWSGRLGLDGLRDALRQSGLYRRRLGSEPVDYQFDDPRCLVSDGIDQLHNDHRQYESAGHELLSHAADRLVALHHRHPVIACPAGVDGGFGDVALRPHPRDQLLFRKAAARRCSGSICSGSSAIRKSMSWCFQRWE